MTYDRIENDKVYMACLKCGETHLYDISGFEIIDDYTIKSNLDINFECVCGNKDFANNGEIVKKYKKSDFFSSTPKQINIPKCPCCGSTNVNKISTGKKAVGFAMVGLFSSNLGKNMECKNCGNKW